MTPPPRLETVYRRNTLIPPSYLLTTACEVCRVTLDRWKHEKGEALLLGSIEVRGEELMFNVLEHGTPRAMLGKDASTQWCTENCSFIMFHLYYAVEPQKKDEDGEMQLNV